MYVAIKKDVVARLIEYLENKPLPHQETDPLLKGLREALPVKLSVPEQPKEQEERHGDQANDSE